MKNIWQLLAIFLLLACERDEEAKLTIISGQFLKEATHEPVHLDSVSICVTKHIGGRYYSSSRTIEDLGHIIVSDTSYYLEFWAKSFDVLYVSIRSAKKDVYTSYMSDQLSPGKHNVRDVLFGTSQKFLIHLIDTNRFNNAGDFIARAKQDFNQIASAWDNQLNDTEFGDTTSLSMDLPVNSNFRVQFHLNDTNGYSLYRHYQQFQMTNNEPFSTYLYY